MAAAGKFSFLDIMNAKSREEAGVDQVESYTEIFLNPNEVEAAESNFYSQDNIQELADTFLAVGQQQPTVLARINGKFRIISGHRRNLANRLLIEQGHREFEKVRYLYKDMTEATFELSLIVGNAYNRELTAYEKTEQSARLKKALIRAQKEDGITLPGTLRETVAELLGESKTNVARMDKINSSLTGTAKEEFKNGNMGISAAYEASKLPEEEQEEIGQQAAAGQQIRAKEIAERVQKTKEERYAEEQNRIDRQTRAKLIEMEDERRSHEETPEKIPVTHEIRASEMNLKEILSGSKRFELTKDKGYSVGDKLKLTEYKAGQPTERTLTVSIIYKQNECAGLNENYCVLGIRL